MVKLKNPLLSLMGSGKLAGLTFRRFRNLTIAEKIPHIPDAKTPPQLSWRNMYQKAVALWHALSPEEKQEWESMARPKHMTGFAWFVSQALKPNPGLYLPLLGGIMQGNINMATNVISALPDPVAGQDADTKSARDAAITAALYVEGARVTITMDKDIPDSNWTTLYFNSEFYDSDNIHDNTTNNDRLTCRTPGKYAITAHIAFTANVAGIRSFRLTFNNADTVFLSSINALSSGETFLSLATILDLSLNDFVNLKAFQSSGITLYSLLLPDYAPVFSMQRIG